MLLTSRSARSPLTHFDRVKLTPGYDPKPCIRLRSPTNADDLHSPQSNADSPLAPMWTATDPYSLHQPTNPSPLRCVINIPEQPPSERWRRVNFGTPGSKLAALPTRPQQNLTVRKKVRFKGGDVIIPPPPESPSSTPLVDSWTAPDEGTPSTSRNYFRIPPVFSHETPAIEDVPDSPSVYSPTPPNSSTPPSPDPLEGWRGWSKLIDHFMEQPCGEGRSSSASNDVSRDAREEDASDLHHGNSDDGLSLWDRVAIAAGSVALGLAKAWGKTDVTATKELNGSLS